jgi:oligosaccharide repeat unit polymerase
MTIAANAYGSVDMIEDSILLSCVMVVIYCLTDFKKRLPLLLFVVCVFTFLVAKVMLGYFTGEKGWDFGLSDKDLVTAINILIYTLLALMVGFAIAEKKRIKIKLGRVSGLKKFFDDNSYNLATLKQVNFIIWLVSLIFTVGFNIQKMLYALANGYISLYTTYQSSGWASQFQLVFTASLFIGLAANPSRRRMWIYLLFGFLVPLITLVQGSRGAFVSYIVFAFYYIYENDIKLINRKNKKRNSGSIKWIILAVVAGFIILPFMYSYGHTRSAQSYTASESAIDGVKNFFFEESESFKLVKYAIRYNGKLPQKYYSLGTFINTVTHTVYASQTAEKALYGHSFGDVITYTVAPNGYLNGFGYGSSYVAEVYYDFEYIGVVIVNMFLGWVLSKCSKLDGNGVLLNSILFFTLYYLFVIPRSPLLYPVNNLFSTSVIATYVCVFALAYKRDRGE